MSNFASSQFIPNRQPRGRAGDPANASLYDQYGSLPIAGRTSQVSTITITSPVNLAAYSIEVPEIDGLVVPYVGSTTATLTAANLVTAWNSDPMARALGLATNAAGVVTITAGDIGGSSYDVLLVSSSAVAVVVATTPSADPPDYAIARAVYINAQGRATNVPPSDSVVATVMGKLMGFSYNDYQKEGVAHDGQRFVPFVRSGTLLVEDGDAAIWMDIVYLGCAVGTPAELGRVFAAAGAGRLALPVDKVRFGSRPNSIDICLGR